MLLQPVESIIRQIQRQAADAPSLAVSYQIVSTFIDLGVLTILLSIISFIRFLFGPDRRKKAGMFFASLTGTLLFSCAIYLIYWIVWYFKRDAIDTPLRMMIVPSGFPIAWGLWELVKMIFLSLWPAKAELTTKAATTGLGMILAGAVSGVIYTYLRSILGI